VEYTWNYLLKRGAKPEKTVLGVPLYGRAFSLENPHDNEMGARALETSFQVRTSTFKKIKHLSRSNRQGLNDI
jgi:GH18 family chitinase